MAKTDFKIFGSSIGRILSEPTRVTAEGTSDYPSLIVPVSLIIESVKHPSEEVPQFTLLSIQSRLYIESSPNKIADSIPIIEPLEFIHNSEVSANHRLEFPLDFHRIKAIEERRTGSIRLGLGFSFLVGKYETLSIGSEQEPKTENFLTRCASSSTSYNLDLNIPQSYWVESVLPLLGLGEYFIIEMPKGKATLQAVWNYLERAELGYRNWNSKEVFGNCREIGTLLDASIKAKFGTKSFSYEERWGRAFDKFNHLASLDLHLEDVKKKVIYAQDSVKTNKPDAEHLLIRTRSLIKYAEELLQE